MLLAAIFTREYDCPQLSRLSKVLLGLMDSPPRALRGGVFTWLYSILLYFSIYKIWLLFQGPPRSIDVKAGQLRSSGFSGHFRFFTSFQVINSGHFRSFQLMSGFSGHFSVFMSFQVNLGQLRSFQVKAGQKKCDFYILFAPVLNGGC